MPKLIQLLFLTLIGIQTMSGENLPIPKKLLNC
jgi:hypothetical protein